MRKIQFLLLDAGPIIKLFELCIWEDFIKRCDITISRTVAEEAKWASQEDEDISIDIAPFEEKNLVKIFDLESSVVKTFHDKFDLQYKEIIHAGEKETLAFLDNSSKKWALCSADKAVFKVLGLLNRGEQGISLEEVLKKTGLGQVLDWQNITPRNTDWKYTKQFRDKYTKKGKVDFVQGQGLR